MGKIQSKTRICVMIIVLLITIVFTVIYVRSTSLPGNLHQGFTLKAGEVPPQFIPERYGSRVLGWITEQRIRSDYNIAVLYDVPGAMTDDYYAESLYSYANTMALFFAYEEGMQLEAGDKLRFEYVMADQDTNRVCIGYARDRRIIEPSQCQYITEGDNYIYSGEIEITKSGVYYPYIVNLSNETGSVKDFRISVDSGICE